MKKVLTLALVFAFGSYSAISFAQQSIAPSKIVQEDFIDGSVKSDTKLPMAISGYAQEGDTPIEGVENELKLPMAISGYTQEGDTPIEGVENELKLPMAISGYTQEGDTPIEGVENELKLPMAISGYTQEGDTQMDDAENELKLPKAISGYTQEGDTQMDDAENELKLPMAISGYMQESDVIVEDSEFGDEDLPTLQQSYTTEKHAKGFTYGNSPFFSGSKVTGDDFSLYPTLATDVVHVTSNLDGLVRMVVYDLNGDVKLVTRFESSFDLDVSGYGHGTFVVRIGRGGEYFTFKFLR